MKLYQKVMVLSFTVVLLASGVLTLALGAKSDAQNRSALTEAYLSLHYEKANDVKASFDREVAAAPTRWLTEPEIAEFAAAHGLYPYDGSQAGAYVRDGVLTVKTVLVLQNTQYILETTYNVPTFAMSEALGAAAVCGVCAFAVAFVISFAVYASFAPLRRLEKTARELAAGKYSSRLSEEKGDFAPVCAAFNAMADSIGDNVGRLSDIAESRKTFADNLAHEMKTPLTSILCMADLLKLKKDVTEKQRREYAGVIVDEARRMKELSAKLLAMASTDNSSLTMEPCSLTELVDELAAAMRPICEKNGVSLVCEGRDGIITADRELFKSLLANLVDNAVKASSPNQTVKVSYYPDGGVMKLLVVDNGIGMRPEDVRHATEPFYMADKARSRKAGGAGLGLALCAVIAKKHNAVLEIQSEKGRGTAVIISLPMDDEP